MEFTIYFKMICLRLEVMISGSLWETEDTLAGDRGCHREEEAEWVCGVFGPSGPGAEAAPERLAQPHDSTR